MMTSNEGRFFVNWFRIGKQEHYAYSRGGISASIGEQDKIDIGISRSDSSTCGDDESRKKEQPSLPISSLDRISTRSYEYSYTLVQYIFLRQSLFFVTRKIYIYIIWRYTTDSKLVYYYLQYDAFERQIPKN